MSKFTLLLLFSFLCLCSAQSGRQTQQCQRLNQCQLRRIQALRPQRRIESEGGITEMWLENNDQFRCVGVAIIQQTIRPNSFLMPGKGLHSVIVPGCPETYQAGQQFSESTEGTQQGGARLQDEHQKVRRVREGDIVANPTGMVHWFHNDGNTDLILVSVIDTASNMNQLDQQLRKFYLGGDHGIQQKQHEQQEQTYYHGARPEQLQRFEANNIFGGIDDEILQEVLGVSKDMVERIKSRGDLRGHMLRAKSGFQLIRPSKIEEEEGAGQCVATNEAEKNGLEETLCTARLRENIDKPSRADVYNPQAGRLRTVNRLNLPDAVFAPHWNLNAHAIIYVTRGSARVQIVGNQQQSPVFDGQVQQGQVLVVPQNFVVVKQAGPRGFEWVSFKTHDTAMIHSLAGKTSPFRGLPVDMLASMYQISRQEAENLKYNRGQEVMIFAPSRRSPQGIAKA
ncbi:hypothetical protein Syun_030064 [Stephania yunnanensis]|uniref:Cupin type-1 domain-containing protein n=1 Tax=Stephania yunnanensis TaxID=152371 RepID=A0AAP0E6K9_9MAGN